MFARVVPFLVRIGSLAPLFEPRLRARRERRAPGDQSLALSGGLVPLSFYNGYSGAGSGVMTLTLLLVLFDGNLISANALKNMIIGAAVMMSAAIFVTFGPVHWAAAVPLGSGMLAGSRIRPTVARLLPLDLLRRLIVA